MLEKISLTISSAHKSEKYCIYPNIKMTPIIFNYQENVYREHVQFHVIVRWPPTPFFSIGELGESSDLIFG